MSDLESKAKTKREIWEEPDMHRQKPETSVDTKWVLLEDAQKALDAQRQATHDSYDALAKSHRTLIERLERAQQILDNDFDWGLLHSTIKDELTYKYLERTVNRLREELKK